MPVPQHTNAVDCGIYTLLFAERLMHGYCIFTVYITVERNAEMYVLRMKLMYAVHVLQ